MLAISPHAVMRHHNHRNTSTTPMPAPSNRLVFHAVSMLVNRVMMASASTMMNTLAARATQTSERGEGSRFSTNGQKKRL